MKPVVVFGAGSAGRISVNFLKGKGMYVVAFVDNDKSKHGQLIDGIQVISPLSLKSIEFDEVYIASFSAPLIWNQVIKIGIPVAKIRLFNFPSIDRKTKYWRERHLPNLRQFKNKHDGQDCFIIGNGPSLNQMDLSLLSNYYTFGLNKIHLIFERILLKLDYHVSINHLVVEQSWRNFAGQDYTSFVSYKAADVLGISEDDRLLMLNTSYGYGFSPNLEELVSEGCTVTYVAMQLAYYMGFENVFLIGVDHRFSCEGNPNETQKMGDTDPNHFHPDYFANQSWQLPDLQGSEFAYKQAKSAFETSRPPRKIWDATVDGALTVFEKIPFSEAVKRCRPKVALADD